MASKLAKVLMLASLSHEATCHTLNMVSQNDDDLQAIIPKGEVKSANTARHKTRRKTLQRRPATNEGNIITEADKPN